MDNLHMVDIIFSNHVPNHIVTTYILGSTIIYLYMSYRVRQWHAQKTTIRFLDDILQLLSGQNGTVTCHVKMACSMTCHAIRTMQYNLSCNNANLICQAQMTVILIMH